MNLAASKPQIRILIVDDHPLIRLGMASIINSQTDMEVVGQSSTEDEAVLLYGRLLPDLTLMDLRLAQGSGLTTIRRILALNAKARVIVLTTYEGDEDIHQALAAGARSYLIKGMSHAELLRALRHVYAGHRFLPPAVTNTLSSRVPSTVLTQREQQVLQFMFRGMSNREISQELRIGEATVKTHVSVVLSKLNVQDRTQAVVEALKRGLVHL